MKEDIHTMQLTDEQKKKIKAQRKTLADKPKERPELVFGLFPKGFMSMLASPPGIGKTWLTLYLTTAGSLGYDVFGHVDVVRKSVIMSGETGVDMLIQRIHQTNWEYKPENVSLYSSFQMSMAGIETSLNTEEGRNTLIEILTEEHPDIVFFDTLISFHSFDESKQAEMSRLYLFLCRLASMFDFALVLNHHTRKRSSQNPNRTLSQDDIIGTSAGIRLASYAYVLQPNEDEDKTSFVLKNVKAWGKKTKPIGFFMADYGQGKVEFIVKYDGVEDETIKEKVRTTVLQNAVKGSVFRVKDMAVKFRTTDRTVRKYLEAYAEPDPDTGTILLNRLTLGTETLYIGNLTLAELSSYKKEIGAMDVNAETSEYKPSYSGSI